MTNLVSAIQNTVSITLFNKGQAGELENSGFENAQKIKEKILTFSMGRI